MTRAEKTDLNAARRTNAMRLDGDRRWLAAQASLGCRLEQARAKIRPPRADQAARVTGAEHFPSTCDEKQFIEAKSFHELRNTQTQRETSARIEIVDLQVDERHVEHGVVLTKRFEQSRQLPYFSRQLALEPFDRGVELPGESFFLCSSKCFAYAEPERSRGRESHDENCQEQPLGESHTEAW